MKNQKKVYCRKCAHLLLIKKANILALCVGEANFKDGSLRSKIDVTDVVPAEKKNRNNDCADFRRFPSYRILQLKNIARRSINAKGASIKEYSVKTEKYNTDAFLKKEQKTVEVSEIEHGGDTVDTGNNDISEEDYDKINDTEDAESDRGSDD